MKLRFVLTSVVSRLGGGSYYNKLIPSYRLRVKELCWQRGRRRMWQKYKSYAFSSLYSRFHLLALILQIVLKIALTLFLVLLYRIPLGVLLVLACRAG